MSRPHALAPGAARPGSRRGWLVRLGRSGTTLVLLAGLAAALLVALAPAAQAHGRGTDATNYRSEIVEAPDLEGVDWRVYGGDELLSVRNRSGKELIVYGYREDPRDLYLRIDADGVFENRNSPATYLNVDRFAQVEVPDDVDPAAPPQWERVSSADVATWHDHRMHYMAPGLHPSITDPSEPTLVFERWEVPFRFDGQDYVLVGQLRWVPGPEPWPWLLLGLVLTMPALVGLRTQPIAAGRWPGATRPAAVVLGLVTLANLTHLVDDFAAVPLPVAVAAVAGLQTAMFLAIGFFGAWRGWTGGDGAFTALGVGAGAVLVGQGLLYWPVLTSSQISTVFPELLARVLVGASIAQAIPIGVVAVVGTRRILAAHDRAPGAAAPDTAGISGESGD